MDALGYAPQTLWDVLLLPMLLTFFAVMVRLGSYQYEQTYGRRPNAHIGSLIVIALLLGTAIYMGAMWMYRLYDPNELNRMFYHKSGFITGKVRVAHYLSFFVPLGTALLIAFLERRRVGKVVGTNTAQREI